MKQTIILILLILIASCKTKQLAIKEAQTEKSENIKATTEIIKRHYDNPINFNTLYIKSDLDIKSKHLNQGVTAEIKIEKDKQILVSIRFLGITMAKALITPTKVSYYEKMGSTYFEGDFSGLSQWLGVDLDYSKLQNMLIGEAFDDLLKGKYTQTSTIEGIQLDEITNTEVQKSYVLNENDFLVNKQQIIKIAEEQRIEVFYSNFKTFKEMIIPATILVNTFQKNEKTTFDFNYQTITFNDNLSFPYSIPSGYKKITLN